MDSKRYGLRYLPIAESFEPYYSPKERRYPYYRIYVKNYIVYYVVVDDEFEGKVMEVRRFFHERQDRKNPGIGATGIKKGNLYG